jgi:hypothetical protein
LTPREKKKEKKKEKEKERIVIKEISAHVSKRNHGTSASLRGGG